MPKVGGVLDINFTELQKWDIKHGFVLHARGSVI